MALASWWKCDFDVDCAYIIQPKPNAITRGIAHCACVCVCGNFKLQTARNGSRSAMLRGIFMHVHAGVVVVIIIVKYDPCIYIIIIMHHASCTMHLALLPALGIGILESGSEPRTSGCEPSRTRIRTKLDSDPNQAN
jgi:hypothetical protein